MNFGRLSRSRKIRRFRNLAKTALKAFGLEYSRFTFVVFAGNVLYRVYDAEVKRDQPNDSPFAPGQYLLRIHDSTEQPTEAIRLEMEWLSAIRQDTGLSVPEPIPAADGELMVQVSADGIPGVRDCTLLRWLRGRRVTKRIRPHHYRLQGRIMAQLHNHAANWSPSTDKNKRRFDCDGLFKEDAGSGMPNQQAWQYLGDRHKKAYESVSRRISTLMEQWGKSSDVYGLIHGDCGVDANVLFWRGEAQIIDFDGSGFGYYLYDLALALEHCWDEPDYGQYLDALLEGYTAFRPLSAEQLESLDLFRAAFYVYMGLWSVAMDQTHPNSVNKQARHEKWLGYGLKFVERYLECK